MFSGNLAGLLLFAMISAVLLTVIFSFIILARYKQAVIRGMSFDSTGGKKLAEPIHTQRIDQRNAVNIDLQYINWGETPVSGKFVSLKKFLARRLAIYAIAILCFAVLWTYTTLRYDDIEANRYRVLLYVISFFWPFVFIQNNVWTTGIERKMVTYVMYFLSFLVVALLIISGQDENFNSFYIVVPWLMINTIPTVFILFIRIGKIKPVSSLVMAFNTLACLVACIIVSYFASNQNALEGTANFLYDSGLNVRAIYALVLLVAVALGAAFLWLIRKLYRLKWINEQQLTSDAILLIFNTGYAMVLLLQHASFSIVLMSMLPFLCYKLISELLFSVLKVRSQNPDPKKLLLLRVFALDKASRISFESIYRYWQYAGPVLMISGPDLATLTIDTHSMVNFVINNLKKQFCSDSATLERNLKKIDLAPDKDGSFRISELFCRNNIWKDALVNLVTTCDVALIDLRGFSEKDKGCQFEIQQLVNYMPLNKVIILVDRQTDIKFLKLIFFMAFTNVVPGSPNRKWGYQLSVYFFKAGNSDSFFGLLNLLCKGSDAQHSFRGSAFLLG